MGDLVLTEDEVNPVMAKLLAGGIEVTALHNHLLRNRPFTMYMHVLGQGDPVKLATRCTTRSPKARRRWRPPRRHPEQRRRRSISTPPRSTARSAPRARITAASISSASRALSQSRMTDMVVPASMGLANAINFQPTGGGKAAITGDFVLTDKEVAPVMKALRENGIEVTALHNHMLGEQPRLYFMHFWAHDDALKLAAGLKAALSHVNHCQGLSAARAMLLLALLLLSPLMAKAQTAAAPLQLEAKIPLGPVSGRIDHLAIDLRRQWLFVAELGNDSVGVIDLANQKLHQHDARLPGAAGYRLRAFDRYALHRKCGGRVGTPYARR